MTIDENRQNKKLGLLNLISTVVLAIIDFLKRRKR